jgi:DNA polymerase-3 subunit epsilon
VHKIKHELPVYNRKLRRNERLWGLKKTVTTNGYIQFTLTPLNPDELATIKDVFAIYRTKRQAKNVLERYVKEQGLCPKLLGIEAGKGVCFSSQLGICRGACARRVQAEVYNEQVELLFANQKLRQWPYDGPKEVVKSNYVLGRYERFVIDNWVLQSAEVLEEQATRPFFTHAQIDFDYDIYKILVKEILR